MNESFLNSDIGSLKKVLVKPPGEERKRVKIFSGDIPEAGYVDDIIGEHAIHEHAVFRSLLEESGAELVDVLAALNSALQRTYGTSSYEELVKKHFPKIYEIFGVNRILTAEDLTGAGHHYPKNPGEEPYITEPLQWMYYTRDFAVMTPKGIILPWLNENYRRTETALARYMFQHSEQLSGYPIIFDAEQENVAFQGGDTIVLDNENILLGVQNLSSEEAARKIAIATGMNVIGVKMPSGPESTDKDRAYWSKLNILFLHLDTIFNLADYDTALTIPYVLSESTHNPLVDMLDSTAQTINYDSVQKIRKSIEDLGNVTIFQGNSGRAHITDTKLNDYLAIERNMQFAYVGGDPFEDRQKALHHFTEHVLPEIRFQGGNIVAVEPGHVLMYDADTSKSADSLRKLGIKVTTFDGHELARWNGGPHCMTCPLERNG